MHAEAFAETCTKEIQSLNFNNFRNTIFCNHGFSIATSMASLGPKKVTSAASPMSLWWVLLSAWGWRLAVDEIGTTMMKNPCRLLKFVTFAAMKFNHRTSTTFEKRPLHSRILHRHLYAIFRPKEKNLGMFSGQRSTPGNGLSRQPCDCRLEEKTIHFFGPCLNWLLISIDFACISRSTPRSESELFPVCMVWSTAGFSMMEPYRFEAVWKPMERLRTTCQHHHFIRGQRIMEAMPHSGRSGRDFFLKIVIPKSELVGISPQGRLWSHWCGERFPGDIATVVGHCFQRWYWPELVKFVVISETNLVLNRFDCNWL